MFRRADAERHERGYRRLLVPLDARRESFDDWFDRQYPDLAPDRQPAAPNVLPPAALQPRQLTAARLLLAGRRVKDVAARLGVHRHTVSAWLKDPDFQQEVSRLATVQPLADLCAGADGHERR